MYRSSTYECVEFQGGVPPYRETSSVCFARLLFSAVLCCPRSGCPLRLIFSSSGVLQAPQPP